MKQEILFILEHDQKGPEFDMNFRLTKDEIRKSLIELSSQMAKRNKKEKR